jgi:hypothetical protein
MAQLPAPAQGFVATYVRVADIAEMFAQWTARGAQFLGAVPLGASRRVQGPAGGQRMLKVAFC